MENLKYLLEGLSYTKLQGELETEITSLVYDSRKAEEGCLYVCIDGTTIDGHAFIDQALEKKAAALVVSKKVKVPSGITVIEVADTRKALAALAAAWFHHPARRIPVIGITGTKGKTTTTYMIKSILEKAGYRVGLIGTIEVLIGEKIIKSQNTTPESYLIQQYFAEMLTAGLDVVVMEVSSQGLMMHRTGGFQFEIGIFTNIEPDHIGPLEHPDFDDYLRCKSLLFQQCRFGIINMDDPSYKKIVKDHTCALETFGFDENADLRASAVALFQEEGSLGVSYQVSGLVELAVKINMPGRFSIYNSLMAIAVCRHFKVEQQVMKRALSEARVKGRIEMVKVSDKFTLMIDYAHNSMSLTSLLQSLKEYSPKRLICVFGCGGNRAKIRRYEMGEASGRLADLTVITSDNPRFEDPQDIINDIKSGIEKTTGAYVEIIDRKEAIRFVIANGRPGDVIVLAGKGHEDYQEIKGKKFPLDERVLIREVMEEMHSMEELHSI